MCHLLLCLNFNEMAFKNKKNNIICNVTFEFFKNAQMNSSFQILIEEKSHRPAKSYSAKTSSENY